MPEKFSIHEQYMSKVLFFLEDRDFEKKVFRNFSNQTNNYSNPFKNKTYWK